MHHAGTDRESPVPAIRGSRPRDRRSSPSADDADLRRSEPERLEVFEAGLDGGIGQPERTEATCEPWSRRRPAGVDLVVVRCRCDGWPVAIVEERPISITTRASSAITRSRSSSQSAVGRVTRSKSPRPLETVGPASASPWRARRTRSSRSGSRGMGRCSQDCWCRVALLHPGVVDHPVVRRQR